MKFIEEQKKIQYFGIELVIPANIKYIATDESGYIYAYTCKPIEEEMQWFALNGDIVELCIVDLEGVDWKETLVCI